MITPERMRIACALLLVCTSPAISAAEDAAGFYPSLREAQQRVVKIYGAGGLRQMEAYQTGVLISADGQILTVLSYVLDTEDLAVVLDDGRKFSAEQIATDPLRELALLKLEADEEQFPHFDLTEAAPATVGDRVLALSNLYGIASGNEPVSVLQGVITAIAPLEARRGSFFTTNHEPVYIVDAYANNPGAAGGALVDWHGKLLGLLGKELKSQITGTWLNYALMQENLLKSVRRMESGEAAAPDFLTELSGDGLTPEKLGIRMVPDVLPRTPPFVDAVRARSAAEQAGLQPDDLIVFVAGRQVASSKELAQALQSFERGQAVTLGILREGGLVEVTLQSQPGEEKR